MPRRTHFKTDFDSKDKPVTLFCVISPDNPKQQGENFLEFVRMVNEKTTKEIGRVTIIDGSYLNRYCKLKYSDHQNQQLVFEWRNANLRIIEQLQVPYTVMSWHQLISDEKYKNMHERITKMFNDETDGRFREIVIAVASKYSSYKGTQKQCVQYLLEECAGALLINGYLTYPGDLNEAILYAINQLATGPRFVSYVLGKVHQQEPPSPKTSDAVTYAATTAMPPALIHFFAPSVENRTTPFPNKMIFRKENHIWAVECEIQFFDEARDVAIRFLLENIQEAQDEYMREKEKCSYPLVLEYKRQFTTHLISYRIEIRDRYVMETVNPFDMLVSATKLENSSHKISESSYAPAPSATNLDK